MYTSLFFLDIIYTELQILEESLFLDNTTIDACN